MLRQTHDTDVAVDLTLAGFRQLALTFEGTCSIAEPIDLGEFARASIIDRASWPPTWPSGRARSPSPRSVARA